MVAGPALDSHDAAGNKKMQAKREVGNRGNERCRKSAAWHARPGPQATVGGGHCRSKETSSEAAWVDRSFGDSERSGGDTCATWGLKGLGDPDRRAAPGSTDA